METCSNKFMKDMSKNVPRDIVSFEGDANSPTKCIQKCLYWYNYKPSSCVVTNDTDMLSVQYDGGGDVTFNTATYTPTNVRIFSPSIHKYNGRQALAELVIEHTSKAASMAGLLVCIPLDKTGVKNGASEMVETIIQNAPRESSVSETVNLPDFNLSRIIPKAAYYTYSGPLPYQACAPDNIYQYVVFHPARNGAITLDPLVFAVLQKMISYSYIIATRGDDVFHNPKGTTENGFNGEDQIYIQCNPAGESTEEEIYKEPSAKSFDSNSASKEIIMAIVYVVVGALIIYLCFAAMKKVVEHFSYPPKTIDIS